MDDKEYLVEGRGSYMGRGSRFESRGRGSKDEVEGRNSRAERSKILNFYHFKSYNN
jgi:ribose 1,5-bisphosphokinase PhnN